MSVNIIKVGGAVVEDPQLRSEFLSLFSSMPGRRILVHGGGRTATAIAGKLGIETKKAEGEINYEEEMLEVNTRAYCKLVN